MVKSLAIAAAFALSALCAFGAANDEYPEFRSGESTKGEEYVQAIKVLAPQHRSEVRGNVTVEFEARGMKRALARCWRHVGGAWGSDATLADISLKPDGRGRFVFRADDFPAGPTTIRIEAIDGNGLRDYCELQLYNLGGVPWRQGIPKADPPGARGMKLVYKDDFDGPLSISPDGRGAKYAAHKTGGGDFSGWPFSDQKGDCMPFGQQGTYLRIHASKPAGSKGCTGIISSLRSDGTGVAVPVPAYFECRLMCHSAPGSWGAFWTLTKGTIGMNVDDPRYAETKNAGCDELDVIECYGGYGKGHPNHGGKYGVTTHWWGQPQAGKPPHAFPDAMQMAGRSSWSWTFHTYGLAITETDTVYYFDDVEVLRHPTGPVTKSQDTWFLINYAIAGISGWPYDLERYGNESDMWIDWVRVYCGRPLPKDFGEVPSVGVKGSIGVNFSSKADPATVMRLWDVAGDAATGQAGWNNADASARRFVGLLDSCGSKTSVSVAVEKSARFETCESWGFRGGDERLHRGGIAESRIAVRDVPFRKWDLVVHFGAGVNGWTGDVELLDRSGREIASRAVNFGWIGDGRYVEATRGKGADSDGPECFAAFRGLSEKDVAVRLSKRGGKGAVAVAGVQVVPSAD
ncbi:MAG: family 16 glycosylhydrolase [Kiritimatiellae bacterium]|nr:family 16 glycosylhydrolase [Kiritimatiellia bacterium]